MIYKKILKDLLKDKSITVELVIRMSHKKYMMVYNR